MRYLALFASLLTAPFALAQVSFVTNANGLASVILNGTEYNYLYGEKLLSYVTYSPGGQVTPNCTRTFDAFTVTHNCMGVGHPTRLTVGYTPSVNTLCADVTLVNLDTNVAIAQAWVSTLGLRGAIVAAASKIGNVGIGNPISSVVFSSGKANVWMNPPSVDTRVNVFCSAALCKNQLVIQQIAPGQSKTRQYCVDFSSDPAQPNASMSLAAYQVYARTFPMVTNWPDRRPIMSLYLADHSHQSAINPRGYLNDSLLDVSTPSFATKMLAYANGILAKIKARSVQPQGVVIWNLEGEEFIHPTTYVGDPAALAAGYAPEMNAVSDQVFKIFSSAGYRVGVTLRPQKLQFFGSAPTLCHADPQNDFKDYFIKVNAPFQQAFFACYSTNTWSLIPTGNGGQTFFQPSQSQTVADLLLMKARYAHSRWGATLFYVDSTVWHGGAPLPSDIFVQLQKALPDSLFMPEQETLDSIASGAPFTDARNASDPRFTPATWRLIYPAGTMAVDVGDCVGACWTTNLSAFNIGQKIGDIALYANPQQLSVAHLAEIEAMIVQARVQGSSVIVSDVVNGRVTAYSGNPSTFQGSPYPLKMRVYFAASSDTLPTSTVYCEAGQLLGENSCTLDLSGMHLAQVRYYDFTGQRIFNEANQIY